MHYQITKYRHACLWVTKNDQHIVIDPGSFTELPGDLTAIVAVVITEEHSDHFSIDNVKALQAANPQIVIYSTSNVAKTLAMEGINAESGMTEAAIAGFYLHFFETDHAPVYKDSPCRSMPVLIDKALYYPSDTYHVIDEAYDVLALPVSGPWHKIAESIDFLKASNYKQVIATHDALLSIDGHDVTDSFIKNYLPEGTPYHNLSSNESITVEA